MFQLDQINTYDFQTALNQRLNVARVKIDKTFLEGGAVLVSVMDLVNSLVAILDRVTDSLDGEKSELTKASLSASIGELSKLPETEKIRQAGFEQLANMCSLTTGHIAEISETIRYLKTFVITVKIAGAGLTELTGFADEIRERIQYGADEVTRFGQNLDLMRNELTKALSASINTQSDIDDEIPQLMLGLDEHAFLIQQQNAEMASIADEVKRVAQTIQMKIATLLSALQIGDITRQRIEHIQSMLPMVDEFLATEEGTALSAAEGASLRAAVGTMCHAQMAETASEFQRECDEIYANIISFTEDAAQILALRDELVQKLVSGNGNIYQQLEQDITGACSLAKQVDMSGVDADRVVQSVTQTAQVLLHGIEVLRAIKTDINYMALNSNLHCSKLGDKGRSVAVVSGEMRIFAGKLEVPADAIVAELTTVEDTTRFLAEQSDDLRANISEPLTAVLETIRSAKVQIEEGVDDLAEEGQQFFSRINAAIAKLDFVSELGNTFSECCAMSELLVAGSEQDMSSFADRFDSLNTTIYQLYTMKQERDIHIAHLPMPQFLSDRGGSAAINPSDLQNEQHDDDLFDDALF